MKSRPREYSTVIASTTETALQRSIIANEQSFVDGKIITWLDIELPVDKLRKARGHCIDLIGKTDDDEYIICELKFGKDSATDSPCRAADEVMNYLQYIRENYPSLDRDDNIHHTNGKHFYWKDVARKGRPIIAANDAYWSYWIKHREVSIPTDIPCFSLNVDVQYFKKLRNDREKYEPVIQDLTWKRLIP